ncbi:MAG: hypothetical protein EAZ63_03645 [Runella slithyformis]|nr:MAG: hypothetical protein EAZ63_03645 [Runella slithyformis]
MQEIDYSKLDQLLAELYKGDKQYPVPIAETYIHLFNPSDRYSREYAPYMAELTGLGLAHEYGDSGTVMRITPLGREVHQTGGWTAYQAQRQQAQEQEQQLRIKEVEAAVDDAKSSKSSKQASWISALFAGLALLFSVFQCYDNQKKDDAISKLQKQFATTDSLLKHQQQTMKYMHSVLHRPDSSQSATTRKP